MSYVFGYGPSCGRNYFHLNYSLDVGEKNPSARNLPIFSIRKYVDADRQRGMVI